MERVPPVTRLTFIFRRWKREPASKRNANSRKRPRTAVAGRELRGRQQRAQIRTLSTRIRQSVCVASCTEGCNHRDHGWDLHFSGSRDASLAYCGLSRARNPSRFCQTPCSVVIDRGRECVSARPLSSLRGLCDLIVLRFVKWCEF